MQYVENVLDLVGHTPLLRLRRVVGNSNAVVLAKLEQLNPGGSVKDRIGLAMIEEAEKRGVLKPGGTIIEPTSGNTGHGLAIVAALRGYKTVFVMPDKMSAEKVALLRAYGAEVIICPTDVERESPRSYYSVADRLTREIPGAFQPNQYFNQRNPDAHYATTGPEVWEQTEGKITVLVAGMGTGGTISGTGRYLKEKNPNIKVVGADPVGSLYSDSIAPYKVEGVGEDFMPETMDMSVVDRIVQVSDQESFVCARRLAREEGLLVGGSSGLAVHAATVVAAECGEDDVIVVMLADTGRNYLSKFFSDEWMRQNGFLDRLGPARARDALGEHSDGIPRVITVGANKTVGEAIDMMQKYGISQLLVSENDTDNQVIGSLQERSLLDRVYREPEVVTTAVGSIMEEPFATVVDSAPMDDAFAPLLEGGAAVTIVDKDDRPLGIVTRSDLLEFVVHRSRKN
jgi:cystathionine beta-synthase